MINQALVQYITVNKDKYSMQELRQAAFNKGYSVQQVQEAEKQAFNVASDIPLPGQQQNKEYLGEAEGIKNIKGNIYILGRLAAGEVYKWLKQLKTLAIMGICSPIIAVLFYTFSRSLGIGAAALLTAPGIYFFYQSKKEQDRLQSKYNLKGF